MSKKNRRRSQRNNVLGKPTPKQELQRARYSLKGSVARIIGALIAIQYHPFVDHMTEAEQDIAVGLHDQLKDWFDMFDAQTDELRDELGKRLKDE